MRFIRKVLIGIAFSGLIGSNIALVFSGSYLTSITDLLRNTPLTSYLDESLVVKNRKLSSQASKIEQKLTKQRNKTKQVAKRIALRTTTSVTRNLGSAFVEAVPFFGIAAIIGSTYMDIQDGCETLTEINELLDGLGGSTVEDQEKICGMKPPTKEEMITTIIEQRDEWVSELTNLL